MTGRPDNLERLLSEAAEGLLNAGQRDQFLRDLDADPQAAADLRRYVRLARLLAGFRAIDPRLDLTASSRRIVVAVRDEAQAQASAKADQSIDPAVSVAPNAPVDDQTVHAFQAVDELLQESMPALPAVDWTALTARISAAVRREARVPAALRARPTGRRTILTWGARVAGPIAAAAVIALMLWGPRILPRLAKAPEKNDRPSIFFAVETPEDAGQVKFTFDKAQPRGIVMEDNSAEGSGIAFGPPDREAVDPPVDPDMLP